MQPAMKAGTEENYKKIQTEENYKKNQENAENHKINVYIIQTL